MTAAARDCDAVVDSRTYEIRYDRWCGWLLGLLGMGGVFPA
jgi:hypothetical protein